MKPTHEILLATGNPGKLREIRSLLAGFDVTVLAQAEAGVEASEETGRSFAENALIKARHAVGKAGKPAIADDSGLVVGALAGRPGIHSARYAGEFATDVQNVDKLLAELEGLIGDERAASFHCVAAFAAFAGDEAPLVAEGVWAGRILESRRGAGGFGYDPVFYDPVLGKSAAEMSANEKNAVSHRGLAFRRLAAQLAAQGVIARK